MSYKGAQLLPGCLESVERQTIPFQVSVDRLIVDNGSTPAIVAPEGWRVIRTDTNRGNIGGANLCFRHAHAEWVLFLADDIRLCPGAIMELWQRTDPMTITQPLLLTPNGKIDNAGLHWRWPGYGVSERRKPGTEIDAIAGSCYLMRRSLWRALWGLDEALGSSHEDVDLGLAARKLGIVSRCLPKAKAIHLGNQTLKHTITNRRRTFHEARVRVVRKHYRGLNRATRLGAVRLLDAIPRPW